MNALPKVGERILIRFEEARYSHVGKVVAVDKFLEKFALEILGQFRVFTIDEANKLSAIILPGAWKQFWLRLRGDTGISDSDIRAYVRSHTKETNVEPVYEPAVGCTCESCRLLRERLGLKSL